MVEKASVFILKKQLCETASHELEKPKKSLHIFFRSCPQTSLKLRVFFLLTAQIYILTMSYYDILMKNVKFWAFPGTGRVGYCSRYTISGSMTAALMEGGIKTLNL